MSQIKEQIQEEMKTAMRAQDKERLAVIRLILSEIKRKEIDSQKTLDDAGVLVILDKMQKQRKESIAQFTLAKRDDLIRKEQYEFDVIQTFKPEVVALSEQEIEQLVKDAIKSSNATGVQDMGKVIALLRPMLQGRADLGAVSAKVKALLSN